MRSVCRRTHTEHQSAPRGVPLVLGEDLPKHAVRSRIQPRHGQHQPVRIALTTDDPGTPDCGTITTHKPKSCNTRKVAGSPVVGWSSEGSEHRPLVNMRRVDSQHCESSRSCSRLA